MGKAQVRGGKWSCGLSLSVSNSNHSGNFLDTCKGLQGLAGCTSFASSDSKACSTSKFLVFCENALANSTLLCYTNWIIQKKAGMFSQTALPS